MNRYLTAVASIVTAAALLVGCTASPDTDTVPSAVPTAPNTQDTSRPVTLPTAGTDSGGDFATLQRQQEASQVAEAAMVAFVAHTRSYDAWWADLSQFLTPEAAVAWEFTDPRQIIASKITGPTSVVEAPSSTFVVVDVPTDAGIWRIEIVLFVEVDAGDGVWKVFTLQPPETNP